jgi:hypothetical protein
MLKAYASGFDFFTNETWIFGPYFFDRAVGMIAITSLLVMAIKSRVFPGLQYRLAAVGKTALSNYLLTSLLCQFLFLWGPWKLYGKLEYYQLNYILAAIWFLNLTISPLWLRYFEFGPFEWMWRSLTYRKPQAMRVTDKPNPDALPKGKPGSSNQKESECCRNRSGQPAPRAINLPVQTPAPLDRSARRQMTRHTRSKSAGSTKRMYAAKISH